MKKLLGFLAKTILIIIILIIAIIGVYIKIGYDMYKTALVNTPIEEAFETIKAKDNYTKLEDIPKIYREAVVDVEDHRFYEHLGIDYIAICSAIFNDISSGYFKEGGSTITQQLCKNVFFTQERTLKRKIAEVFMSAEVEKECSKDTILELYINTCFYGNNCYTLKEASNLYFKVNPIDMTDYMSTMLAGVPNAPSLYNPINSLDLAQKRQKQVLYAMVKYGSLLPEERDKILEDEPNFSKLYD